MYGVMFAAFNTVCALSSRYLIRLFDNMRLRKVLTLLGVFMAGAYLFSIVLVGKGSIAFLFLGQIVRALYPPIMRFYVNSNVGDAFRATVISIVSLSASLSFAIVSPAIGVGLDMGGAIPVYLVMGSVTLVGSLALWKVRNLQKKKKADREAVGKELEDIVLEQ